MFHGTNCSAVDIDQITTDTDFSTLLQLGLSNIAVEGHELIFGVNETAIFISDVLREDVKREDDGFLSPKKRRVGPEYDRGAMSRDWYSGY